MTSLLTAVSSKRAGWDYVRRLLAACADDDGTVPTTTPGEPAPAAAKVSSNPSANANWMCCGCWQPTWTDRTSRAGSSCP